MQGNAARVLQQGHLATVAEDTLCTGDVVLLQAGDLVPADLKLMEARSLEVDEWELTGEIAPVAKRPDGQDVFIYRGSKIIRGSGKGLVVATGDDTEYARILKQPWKLARPRRPVFVRARHLLLPLLFLPPFLVYVGRHGSAAMPIMLVYLFVAALVVVGQNGEWFSYLLTTRAAQRIEQQNIRILDITALRVILDVDLMCLDKTGVLTTRDLEVKSIYFADEISQAGFRLPKTEAGNLARLGCALCNDVMFAETMQQANPIDQALMSFAAQNGLGLHETALRYLRIYDKPFDSEDRYMAAGFRHGDRTLYFAKGDPEIIVKMCTEYVEQSGSERKIDLAFLLFLRSQMEAINQAGDIAIALAYAPGSREAPPLHYAFLCLLQLENPLHPGVPDVLKQLRERGIRTVMLTGDRAETATKIASEAGIETDTFSKRYLTGKDIVKMALTEVGRQSAYISVFARLLPSQKGNLIRLFQERYRAVAMVGDGANDAIALKAADVSLSFAENGSPFAKRVSMILINDLRDLLTVMQAAAALESQVGLAWIYRTLILAVLLFGLYAWALLAR
jgi:P-type Ca2+ transporter type 2C